MERSEPTRTWLSNWLVVRGLTGTVRQITATHWLDKLDRLSVIKY